ncbi:hypothetical protein chiPu_0033130, partial [Chiloscyllium punctatum]|nr:hypothetical protein [Chiloscyllium punctatum]
MVRDISFARHCSKKRHTDTASVDLLLPSLGRDLLEHRHQRLRRGDVRRVAGVDLEVAPAGL